MAGKESTVHFRERCEESRSIVSEQDRFFASVDEVTAVVELISFAGNAAPEETGAASELPCDEKTEFAPCEEEVTKTYEEEVAGHSSKQCLETGIPFFERALQESSLLALESTVWCGAMLPVLSNIDSTVQKSPDQNAPWILLMNELNAAVDERYLSLPKIDTYQSDSQRDEKCGASLDRSAFCTTVSCLRESAGVMRNVPALNDNMTGASMSFDLLPSELRLKIFSFFSLRDLCRYVSPVCSSWLAFSRDPSLWQRILHVDFKDVSSGLLVKVLTSWCTQLVVLELNGRTDLVKDDFLVICKSCGTLCELSLAFCTQVNNEVLEIVGRCCKSLKSLNVEGTMVTDDFYYRLIGLPITKLNASHCNQITDDGAIFYAQNFKSVSSVNFDGIQWITEAFVRKLVGFHCETLAEVYLDGEDLTDEAVRLLAGCKYLRTLSFSFCTSMTNEALHWVKECKNLSHLKLRKGINFSNGALLSVLQELRSGSTNGRGLRVLSLAECTELSDKCLFLIGQGCPNLEALDLSWCWEVTDEGIAMIIESCSKMRSLVLCGLHELYGWPFRRLPSCVPFLSFLDLRQCNKIKDEVAEELVHCMTNLVVLNYYGDKVKYKRHRYRTLI